MLVKAHHIGTYGPQPLLWVDTLCLVAHGLFFAVCVVPPGLVGQFLLQTAEEGGLSPVEGRAVDVGLAAVEVPVEQVVIDVSCQLGVDQARMNDVDGDPGILKPPGQRTCVQGVNSI